jgi:hypothetical protein
MAHDHVELTLGQADEPSNKALKELASGSLVSCP